METLANHPAEEPTWVQLVGRTRILHNEKYRRLPLVKEHLYGTHQECHFPISAELPCLVKRWMTIAMVNLRPQIMLWRGEMPDPKAGYINNTTWV